MFIKFSRVPKANRMRLPVEQTKISKTDMTLPLSNRCREAGDRESELEAPLRNLILLSRLLTKTRNPHQPGGVTTTKLAVKRTRCKSRCPRGKLLKYKGETLLTTGNRLTTQLPSDRGRNGQNNVPPSLLCPTVGARGAYIVQEVRVDEHDERKEEEEGNCRRRPSSPEPNSMAGRVCARSAGDEVDEHRRRSRGSSPLQVSLQLRCLVPPSYARLNTNTRDDDVRKCNTK